MADDKSKNADEAKGALELLEQLRAEMKRHKIARIKWNEKEPYAQIDRAIQTVRAGLKKAAE